MGSDAKSTNVAERLRHVQAEMGLTIQDMASQCGLPKRSLENYMNRKDPQRPGVDALIAIADGFNLSLDWIVGRTDEAASRFTKDDYAFFCYSTVLAVLRNIVEVARDEPSLAVQADPDKVLGYEINEVAARAMLDFVALVDLQASGPSIAHKGYFKRHTDNLTTRVGGASENNSAQNFFHRKP